MEPDRITSPIQLNEETNTHPLMKRKLTTDDSIDQSVVPLPPSKQQRCNVNENNPSGREVQDSDAIEKVDQSISIINDESQSENVDTIPVTETKLQENNFQDENGKKVQTVPARDNVQTASNEVELLETVTSDQTSQPLPDPLHYTQSEEFTSEIFKIQIHNLPRFGFHQLKSRLVSLGLRPHKIKSPANKPVAYICFRNETERKEAIQKLDGHVWKGKKLEAKEAAPIADPFLKKRKDASSAGPSEVTQTVQVEKSSLSQEEALQKLREHVVPLWNVDYDKQLEMKANKIREVLVKTALHPSVKHQFRKREGWKDGDTPCCLHPIVPSPLTSEYRNKNEFTIGYGLDGKTIKVGFRYGLYKDGTTAVGEPHHLGNVMPAALPVVESFQKFVSGSQWSPFLQQTATGHWHTLTVRTMLTGDIMVMVDFVPRKLEKAEIEEAKASVKEFYTQGEGKDVLISSCYFRLWDRAVKDSEKLELIFGTSHVHESLLGLKFRISPEAFFQVNTPAAEQLYSLISEWSDVSPTTTVLDICCGTGTIGLSMAKKAKEMVGIEMCSPAVDDARQNATLNGITNATFYCAKVEDVISNIMASLGVYKPQPSSPGTETASECPESVVAVVDPPRAGLHKHVIKTLRKCREIQRLVYVSCNPESAMENFVDLMRPATGKHKGLPFHLVQAVPVDLFPGTKHCELVLLFTRQGLWPNGEDV